MSRSRRNWAPRVRAGRSLHPSARSWGRKDGGSLLDDDGIHGTAQRERPAAQWCAEAVSATPLEVWHVPLTAGRHALAFLNRSPEPAAINVDLAAVGLAKGAGWDVRDVWQRTTARVGTGESTLLARDVPAYGVVLPRPGVQSPRVGVFAYVDSWK